WRDLRPILDDAIHRLPRKYRTPFVLCHLEGLTNAQAADRLGCPLGTIATHLSRARERLRARLSKQGVALATAALAVAIEKNAAAATVPLSVVQSVIHAARLIGTTTAICTGAISGQVAALTEGVGKAMFMEKVKSVCVVAAIAVGIVGGGTGMIA